MPTISGKVEPEAADAWRAANRDPSMKLPLEEPAAGVSEVPSEVPKPPAESGTPPAISGLTAARTEREEIKAKREAIKLGLEEGELVSVVETEQCWSEMVTTAKDRLMILPGKLSARLAAVSDEGQVYSILEKEIMTALAEMSRVEVAA